MGNASRTYLFVSIGALALLSVATAAMNTLYLTINFETGIATMSDSDQAKLHDLLADANNDGRISRINVAVWSDESFPRKRKLTDADRDLAELRGLNIRKWLRDEDQTAEVKVYSVTDDKNWLGRHFAVSDSELRATFSKKGAPAPLSREEFRLIKTEGGPSKAVVVIAH